jgi:hypothetical protein
MVKEDRARETAGLERVARAIERSAWEYGKVALLIDDSPESETRVARAVYGSEALPRWWVSVRSMRCACQAMETVTRLLEGPGFRSLRVFILVDRYLPPVCGGVGALAWYRGEDAREHGALVEAMNQGVARLVELSDRQLNPAWPKACLIRFVTSFPVIAAPRAQGASLDWQMRSVELLQEERRSFRDSDVWSCLLHFGPEIWAPIVLVKETPPRWMKKKEIRAARWRAKTWKESLERLVRMFKKERMILITGAGASIKANTLSPGMLTTDEIVRIVCNEMIWGKEETRAMTEIPGCSCKDPKPTVAKQPITGDPMPDPDIPIGKLMSQVWRGEPLDFKLEEVCSPRMHRGWEGFERFHRLFRRELYRRDYGFAYHHWLAGRLPWAAIITTNFDGFHERAAASVARMMSRAKEFRLRVLSLGSVRPIPEKLDKLEGEAPAAEKMGESRLFKPYGSLYSPTGELALGSEDVFNFQGYFKTALQMALRVLTGHAYKGAVVVVGQSMRDELVQSVLTSLAGDLEEYQLIWVDPMSYERCLKKSTLWERWIEDRMQRRVKEKEEMTESAGRANERSCSGPIPATALEFIYDLWTVYQEQQGAGQPDA